MSYRQSGSSNTATGCGVALVIGAIALLIMIAAAPYYFTQFWWEFRANWFWLIPLVVLALMAWAAGTARSVGLWFVTAGAFVCTLVFWSTHSYQEDRYYVAPTQVTTGPVPELAVRPPFNVSEQQVRPNLGEINGDTGTTMYLPDQRAFTTPVEQRGALTGYQVLLTQHMTTEGRNTPQLCHFGPAADRRFGGLFSHSLERLINTQQRFVNWDDDDAYGYCAGPDHPVLVAPLKEQDGWLVVVERPAGLAVYDGVTGELRIVTDPREIAKVPGPTYPLSLAAAQRDALGAINGFSDWFWARAGWELPDDIDEINSSNTTDFVQATTKDGTPQYVNMLTGRGSATAIATITTVDARLTTLDGLAPLVVHHTRPTWQSTESIIQRVQADFGDIFRDQPKAHVFEVAALDSQRWVATIALPQNMLYRVVGFGDLHEAPCLLALTGEQLRCGPARGGTNLGGPVTGQGPASPAPAVGVPGPDDWAKLTKPQLIDIIQKASQELANRPGQ